LHASFRSLHVALEVCTPHKMSGSRPLDATLFIPSELQARPPARETMPYP
jgi:hypothetical protein